MIDDLTFEDVRKLLDLSPNATCGYVRVDRYSGLGESLDHILTLPAE